MVFSRSQKFLSEKTSRRFLLADGPDQSDFIRVIYHEMTQVKNQRAVSHSFIASSSDITGHVWKYKQDNDSSCLEPERIQRMKLQTHYGLD